MESSRVPQFQKPVLLVAAESIALASGMSETVADVLRNRALKHYAEGLRQYMAIRLKSNSAAEKAMAALKSRLESVSSETLAALPGPRAHLYRIARHLLRERRIGASNVVEDLIWLAPAEQAPHSYIAALAQLRRELTPDDAELLELRYARELSPEELSFVVGRSVEDVVTTLERAAAFAARILGNAPPSRLGGLRGALQEAFALMPQPGSQLARGRERASLPVGTVIGDRYAVRERVGEGSFGDVYRALDTDVPGHVVALKLLHRTATTDEARKSALRELRLIASVFHPSVVNFKDHGWYQDRLWFVMPWYDGETLEERIRRTPLTRAEAYDIFVPLTQALTTMHAAGIRHQDIKPDNIFLARIGEAGTARERILPVLIDLGVAAKEAEMIVAGTPLYFAPEIAAQYAGKHERPPVTHKADVFSLALSLRNALEPSTQEEVPGTAVEAFIAHRADSPPGPPTARELKFLSSHFQRWLAKDASARPTAQELVDELTVLTRPEKQRARTRTVMRWAAPLTLGSLVGLSSITYVYLEKRREASAAILRAEVTETRLGEESERRMRLEESYQHSELTRQQLSERLARREGEAAHLGAQLARARHTSQELASRVQGLASELESARRSEQALQRKSDVQTARLLDLESELYSTEQRRAFAESELHQARTRMNAAESELDDLRMRARALLSELDDARAEAHGQLNRVSALEQALFSARSDKHRAERELMSAQQRAEELERQVHGRGPLPMPSEPTE